MLKTERLILRQWSEEDFDSFAGMCADEDVMEFFPATLTRDESVALANKAKSFIDKNNWGPWAVELLADQGFIGFVGLYVPDAKMPCSPCVEIAWRINKRYWGKGYATEAAREALAYAFAVLDLDEIVAFTAIGNAPSRAVMRKIGMEDTGKNFMHPDIDVNNPLCEHVLYKINKSQWAQNTP